MSSERTRVTASTEGSLPDTSRFSDETRHALEERGLVIVDLTGWTIAKLQKAGHKILVDDRVGPGYRYRETTAGEVALHPSRFAIPHSNRLSYPEQDTVIETEAERVVGDVPGAKAFRGGVADYAAADYLYGQEHGGQPLLRRAPFVVSYDNVPYIWTSTVDGPDRIAVIGRHVSGSLVVGSQPWSVGSYFVDAAALYKPAPMAA